MITAGEIQHARIQQEKHMTLLYYMSETIAFLFLSTCLLLISLLLLLSYCKKERPSTKNTMHEIIFVYGNHLRKYASTALDLLKYASTVFFFFRRRVSSTAVEAP